MKALLLKHAEMNAVRELALPVSAAAPRCA